MIVGLCRGLVLAVSAVVASMRRFVSCYMSYLSATGLFGRPPRGRRLALGFAKGGASGWLVYKGLLTEEYHPS